jgi:hypothetical protein
MDYFTGGMAETVEHLLCKLKALFHQKKKKKEKKEAHKQQCYVYSS